MPKERDVIAALFRGALQPRPNPENIERDAVERFVSRAMQQRERWEMRRAIRAVFARLVLQLHRQGWTTAGAGECAECSNDRPHHLFWSKLRPQYVTCPRGTAYTLNAFTCMPSTTSWTWRHCARGVWR
jgi:hypothetical protein